MKPLIEQEVFIVRIDVEHRGDDIYHAGPYRTREDANQYIEYYHGNTDKCEVLSLCTGLLYVEPDSAASSLFINCTKQDELLDLLVDKTELISELRQQLYNERS